MDVEECDRGAVRAQGGDGDVAQPDGLFDQRAGAVVFAQEVAGFVLGVLDRAVDTAADPDPLAEGVVDGGLGGGSVGQGSQAPGVVVAGGYCGIAGGVARGVVLYRLRRIRVTPGIVFCPRSCHVRPDRSYQAGHYRCSDAA